MIPPLLFGDVTDVKEQRRLTLSPFFVRSKTPDSRTLGALGIAWDVKRKDERHSALFPLYYRRQRGDRVLTVTPLGGGLKTAEGSTWAVGPVFGKRQGKSRAFGLAPLFVRDVRPAAEGEGDAKTTVLFPLYFGRRTPTDDLDMVTPFFWRTHVRGEKPRKNLALVPFYFRQRQPDGVDIDAGLPFFYSRDKRRHTHTLVIGPGFHRLSRKALNAGVVPIYWWHDDEQTRRLVSLPIIYHKLDKQSGQRSTVALPLWFDFRRTNGSRVWVAFPFAVGNKKKFNFTRIGIGAPGFVDVFRLGKNYRFTGFVPLFFRYQKCGFREEDDPSCAYKLYGSYPLFMYGSDGQGRRTHSALSLYYFDKDAKGTTLFTPIAGARVRPGEELTWYAGIVGRGVTRKHETTVAFPLFFRRKHRVKHKHTTAVVPPLYIGHRDEDSRWFETALVFWQFRKPHKVSTAVVPPLFYLSESYAERRIHWLLPLYLRDNKMGEDKTFTSLFPLLYFQRRNGDELDVVQFPLIWHIERGENEGTVGAALWWDIRVRGTTTQFIPGVFVRRVNRKGQEFGAVVPGLAWWTRDHKENAKAVHWRALLGAIGGGNEESGQRYFSLFGAKIKLRPKPVWEPKAAERRELRRKRRAEKRALKAAGKGKATTKPNEAAPKAATPEPAKAGAPPKAATQPTTATQPTPSAGTQTQPKTGTQPSAGATQPNTGAPSMGAAGTLTQPTVGGSASGASTTTQGQGGSSGATKKPEG
ncbi:MAG: nucleoporin [Myxococcales bacterium]|nr:nucleoporin [Myxococcales bacterium]